MLVYSPEGVLDDSVRPMAPRPASIQGLRLGLLDNTKAHADHILRYLGERLQERMPGIQVVYRSKRHPAGPAEGALLDELATSSDLVVDALGD